MCPSSSLPSSLLASYLFSNCFELSHLSVSTSCWFHILPFLVQTVDTVQLSLFAALLFYCPCLTSALLNPSLCVLNHPTPPSPPVFLYLLCVSEYLACTVSAYWAWLLSAVASPLKPYMLIFSLSLYVSFQLPPFFPPSKLSVF